MFTRLVEKLKNIPDGDGSVLLTKVMQERGLSVEGQKIGQEVCLDCLQTDGKSREVYYAREKRALERMAMETRPETRRTAQ